MVNSELQDPKKCSIECLHPTCQTICMPSMSTGDIRYRLPDEIMEIKKEATMRNPLDIIDLKEKIKYNGHV